MNRYVVVLSIMVLFLSCKPNTTLESNGISIPELEAKYEKEPTLENLQQLMAAYEMDSTEMSTSKLISLQLKNNQEEKAIALIKTRINKNLNAEIAFQLASAYENIAPEIASMAFQIFEQAYPNYSNHPAFLKIRNNQLDATKSMDSLYQALFTNTLQGVDPKMAMQFLESAEIYALIMPKAEKAPLYLKRAAEVAKSNQDFERALMLNNWILEEYSDRPEAELALFLSAFILDNDLKDMESARKKYELFLEQYPKSTFADDAQFLLQNLGKDDQEILETLQKQK
jgi:tetratricopeptide (TPR) repeat protein